MATLKINIYGFFYLAADNPINALLSKSKSDTSVLDSTREDWETLCTQINWKYNLSVTAQKD